MNIVLSYGAFADGSSWAKVIRILERRGFLSVGSPMATSFG
jgi:hypothetical protein